MYYLIQATREGEQVLLQGDRPRLETIAQRLRQQMPHLLFRVTQRLDGPSGVPLPVSRPQRASECR